MADIAPSERRFCGQPVPSEQLGEIQQLSRRYPHLSRTELAATVCELLGWLRPNGTPKTIECRHFLERLEQQGQIPLPAQRRRRPKGSTTRIDTGNHGPAAPVDGPLRPLQPIILDAVVSAEQREQWRSLVQQYHYLGHRVPFGAHVRYLLRSEHHLLGCLQYSSPAWRIRARDQWIGWDEAQRKSRLQHILCNSRFLILPWVRVPHLASHVLAKAARQVIPDWASAYGVTPWLLETAVDPARYSGTCYRAANWIEVGTTSGRGRQDRHHRRHGTAPKQLWLYPLRGDARERLCRRA